MFTSPQRHQFVASDAKGFGDSVQSTPNTVKKKNKIVSAGIDPLKLSPVSEIGGDFKLQVFLVDNRLNNESRSDFPLSKEQKKHPCERNSTEKPGIDTSHTALLKGRQGFIKGAG
jgi:hypothetical protein